MRVKDAARIFSSSYLKKVAEGDLSFLSQVVSGLELPTSTTKTIKDVYEQVYCELSKHYRHEYYYKNTLTNKQLLGRHSLNTATMLSEFRVGQNIADCVLLNGSSTCYEIKTKYDSLDRLEEQLASYCSLFDKVYVVCDERHTDKVAAVACREVGILQLTKRNTLSEVRKATDLSSRNIDVDYLMGSLRADEYKHLAQTISGYTPQVSNIKMHSACYDIISKADSGKLRDRYREILKTYRKPNIPFITSLPNSLKNAGISYKLSGKVQLQLIDILDNNLVKGHSCITQLSEANSLN